MTAFVLNIQDMYNALNNAGVPISHITSQGDNEPVIKLIAGFTEDQRTLALTTMRAEKVRQRVLVINTDRDIAMAAGVTYNGHTYDSDQRAVLNLTSVLSLVTAGIPLPVGFTWRTLDNVNVPFTTTDIASLGAALLVFYNTKYAESWAAKTAVEAEEAAKSGNIT